MAQVKFNVRQEFIDLFCEANNFANREDPAETAEDFTARLLKKQFKMAVKGITARRAGMAAEQASRTALATLDE